MADALEDDKRAWLHLWQREYPGFVRLYQNSDLEIIFEGSNDVLVKMGGKIVNLIRA